MEINIENIIKQCLELDPNLEIKDIIDDIPTFMWLPLAA